MNLLDAIRSEKPFYAVDDCEIIQYFKSGTGPFGDYYDCDYFMVDEEGTVRLDLSTDEILGEYKVVG